MLETLILEQVAKAVSGEANDTEWNNQDDLCNCTFQRVGFWTNPYIGKTLLVRFCCIWNEFHKQFPEFVLERDSFFNYNTNEYEDTPWEWDSKTGDMPKAIWYRQLATQTGKSLDEVRAEHGDLEPPKRVKRKRNK